MVMARTFDLQIAGLSIRFRFSLFRVMFVYVLHAH